MQRDSRDRFAVRVPDGKPGESTAPAARGRRRRSALEVLRDVGRRHRTPITVAGSLGTLLVLALVLAGRRHEFTAALSQAGLVQRRTVGAAG